MAIREMRKEEPEENPIININLIRIQLWVSNREAEAGRSQD